MKFCTSATVLELPHVRSLADRLAEHHPDARLVALVAGRPALEPDEPFTALSGGQLGMKGYDELAERHRPEDLLLALQPFLLDHVAADAAEPVVYLDPAHEVLAPLDGIATALSGATSVLLSPRTDGPLPADGLRPSAQDLHDDGAIDPGFVALRPGEDAERFLEWWTDRARTLLIYVAATAAAGAGDQGRRQLKRALDLAPALHAGVGLLRDPALEVSGWNLHERSLASAASVALHGYRPDRPHLLGELFTRCSPTSDEQLAALLEEYGERLRRRGWSQLPHRGAVGRTLPGGTVFSDRLLRLHGEALGEGEDFGDLFTPDGAERFLAWTLGPAPHGAQAGISRYLYRVYRDRPDIPVAYPDLDGADGEQFAGWTWVFGRRELDIPDEFLPPVPPHVAQALPASGVPAINVAGYFSGTLGLGEAARLYVTGLEAAGVPVGTRTVDPQLPVDGRAGGRRRPTRVGFAERSERPDAGFNLICVNADELPRFVRQIGEGFLAGRHNIGVWAWETDVVPGRWQDAFGLLDEIWVYSRYVAENIGRAAPVPVVCVPPPVVAPEPGRPPDLGLPEGFRFMFMFDFFSTVQRKNPVAVVEAFRRAFAPGEGPHLVVKTIHGPDRPAAYAELVHAANGHPDVHIVDRSLTTEEKDGLLASCDCYVSLHRSEGWGLPLAECMAMAKPVIATAYSGNLDFMRPGNSYLVDYTLTKVGGEVEIYPAEGTWAQPDVDHAARLMRQVWEDRDEARRRGERASADIAELLAPAHAGAIARQRLERLAARPAPAPAPARPSVVRRVARRVRAR